MNQVDLDKIPEMGLWHEVYIEGTDPPCYRPVRNPVYALIDMEMIYDCNDEPWFVGWHDNKQWKVKS